MNKVWYQVLKHVENMYAYFIRQVSQSSYKLLILFESYTVDYGPGIHESPIRKKFSSLMSVKVHETHIHLEQQGRSHK